MLNETECSCSETYKNQNTTAHGNCTCNHKMVSPAPIIDADENSIMALATMKGEVIEKMQEIEGRHSAARDAELKSWVEEYDRLDALFMEHYRPGCFGSMSCMDAVYELCPSVTVKACQLQCRGRV